MTRRPVRDLSHALDRESMVAAILSGNGAATYGPFPTTDRNYDPAVEALNNYDVAAANELLDQAGMGGRSRRHPGA